MTELLEEGIAGLRVARLGGWFARNGHAEAFAATDAIANTLDIKTTIELPEVHRARAAAFVISAAEGAALHRQRLLDRPQDFDPDTRDRFLANLTIPALWVTQARSSGRGSEPK